MTPVEHRTSRLWAIAEILRQRGQEGWASELGNTAQFILRLNAELEGTKAAVREIHLRYADWTPPLAGRYCTQPADPFKADM